MITANHPAVLELASKMTELGMNLNNDTQVNYALMNISEDSRKELVYIWNILKRKSQLGVMHYAIKDALDIVWNNR